MDYSNVICMFIRQNLCTFDEYVFYLSKLIKYYIIITNKITKQFLIFNCKSKKWPVAISEQSRKIAVSIIDSKKKCKYFSLIQITLCFTQGK